MKFIKVNKVNYLQKNEKYFIYVFITLFFFVCFPILKDFGVTLDDEIYYLNGLNTYNYVKALFLNITNPEINLDLLLLILFDKTIGFFI